MLTVGKRIKELRLKNNLSQSQLAEKAGLSQWYISDLEKGERNFSVYVLLKLCDVFKVSPNELLGWDK